MVLTLHCATETLENIKKKKKISCPGPTFSDYSLISWGKASGFSGIARVENDWDRWPGEHPI